jgi:hypothetical protein
MPEQIQEPGPGRSTAAAAFDELRKEIARRNEQAHQKARKLRPSASGSRSSRVGGGTFRNIPWRWAIVTWLS